MNAYDAADGDVRLVSRNGTVCEWSTSVTTTLPPTTEATSASEPGTETTRSLSGPLGFWATASTSTVTSVRPSVSRALTTTSRAIGGSTGASVATVTVSTAESRP